MRPICQRSTGRPGSSPCSNSLWQGLRLVEFFAGQGEVWRTIRADHVHALGVDISYGFNNADGQNPFDILSDAGLARKPQRFKNRHLMVGSFVFEHDNLNARFSGLVFDEP